MTDVLAGALDRLAGWFSDPRADRLPELFAPTFLAQLPPGELKVRLDRLSEQVGPITGFDVCARTTERSARFEARFGKGFSTHGSIALDDGEPPRIQWLVFEVPTPVTDSWDAIVRDVRKLPGRATFEVRRLDDGAVLAAVDPDRVVGVGSVSKLVLLACLFDAVAAGTRRWDDIVRLADADRSLPTGILQDWPTGAPLTLHSIAVLLVSLSDNTAADLLLRELGRARIEELIREVMPRATLRPFLSTRGLFALVAAGEAAWRAYAAGDEARRRTLLERAEADARPDPAQVSVPWPDELDWRLSAGEVCDLLGRLREQLAGSEVPRGVFGVNQTGLNLGSWRFAGVKGGLSPGRIAFATLLETDRGEWVATCIAHNAPSPELATAETVAALTKRAADRVRTG